MKRKSRNPGFDEILNTLRDHNFEVSPTAGGQLVSKDGAAAVLAAGEKGEVTFVVRPGALVKGEVARLLDRGYQKFIATGQYELPATAEQLHVIHAFSEELNTLVGGEDLYNESLGTTSDRYQYDRLNGREAAQAHGARPWELAAGH